MARNTPVLRDGILTVEAASTGERIEIPAESDTWFTWLQTSRTFAFDDVSGHFTARKKQRLGVDYWYAFRRRGGRFREIYLGKPSDVTLARLRSAAARLNGFLEGTSQSDQPPNPLVSYGRLASSGASVRSREDSFPHPSPKVTPREREILGLIADGATNEEIARELVISPATVKRHVSNILTALNVRNRTQAVARARALGLFDTSAERSKTVHARA